MTSLKFWTKLDKTEFMKIREDMKQGFLGRRQALPCDVVVSDFVLAQHTPLYKVFAKGKDATARSCKDLYFIKNIAQALGEEHAAEEVQRYYDFFQAAVKGTATFWTPRVFYDQGFCRRFDGKHRVCLLRYLRVPEVECVVVDMATIKKWRTTRFESDKHWTPNAANRLKRSPEAKFTLRRELLRMRRDRHEESKERQRRKRARK